LKRISAALITYNEEAKIETALASLAPICDEIIVVDSGSTDLTVDLCLKYTDRVIHRPWIGYVSQKQFATDQSTYEWVLSLDADEEVSPELQSEILKWKQEDSAEPMGYQIPRLTHFMGRWIRHTTWHPDCQLRLYMKSKGRWQGGRVHEGFRLDGLPGRFSGYIYHYTYSSVSEYLVQLESFSSLAAADYYDQGRQANMAHLVFYPGFVFLKNWLFRMGFLDGVPGLVVSVLAATSTFFKFLRLWEMQALPARACRGDEERTNSGPDTTPTPD
jgi:glycosyltransferase involved in cell wall biosynthesis